MVSLGKATSGTAAGLWLAAFSIEDLSIDPTPVPLAANIVLASLTSD